MRAPKHLVDLRDREPAATLLKAARTVSPPRDARARLLAALVSTSALGTSAIAAGAGAAGGSGTALTTVSTTITFSKWVAIGVLAGGASIAGAEGVTQLMGDGPSMQRMSSVVTPAAVAARAPAAPRSSPPFLRQAATAPNAAGQRRAPAALPTASAQPALTVPSASATAAFSSHQPAASTLNAEIAALDAARSALRAGDPPAALNHLSRVEGGMLADEATLIRIQALVSSGDVAGARQVAAAFLSAHPQSPFAGRIRAALPRK
jgi:hypothetical protein